MKNKKSTSGKTPAQIKSLIQNPYQKFAYETSVYTAANISIILSNIEQYEEEYQIINDMLYKNDNVDAQQLYTRKRRNLDDLLTTYRRMCKISKNLSRFTDDIENFLAIENYEPISPAAKEIERLTMKIHNALLDEIISDQHNQ